MRADDRPDAPLVVATYNVHGFVGVDGRFDARRTFLVIEGLDADLVALQEIHSTPEVLEGLAGEIGYRLLLGPTLERGGSHFGNALMTRLPVDAFRRHDLSVDGREPRAALDARFRCGGAGVRMIAVHLGLQAAERRVQIARLASRIGDDDECGQSALRVMLGDFNEWRPASRRLAPLAARVGPFSRLATFPSRLPMLALDRIAVHPSHALLSVESVTSGHARVASDHLPLRARLSVARSPQPAEGR